MTSCYNACCWMLESVVSCLLYRSCSVLIPMTIGTWALQINGGHKDAAPPLGRWCHHLMSQSAVLHQNSNCGGATVDNYFIIYLPQPSPGPRSVISVKTAHHPTTAIQIRLPHHLYANQHSIDDICLLHYCINFIHCNWPHSSVKYCGQHFPFLIFSINVQEINQLN